MIIVSVLIAHKQILLFCESVSLLNFKICFLLIRPSQYIITTWLSKVNPLMLTAVRERDIKQKGIEI